MKRVFDYVGTHRYIHGLFYLENGHAEIRGMMDLKEEFDI